MVDSMNINPALLNYGVIMTTYANSNLEHLVKAVDSTLNSISRASVFRPDANFSLTIGVDGPVSDDKRQYLRDLESSRENVNVHWFSVNRGLGLTLRDLVKLSDAQILIRMDDDDIMEPDRIINVIPLHERGAQLVSGLIVEFVGDPTNVSGIRTPQNSVSVFSAYLRNPLNHVATSYSRDCVLLSGNYRDVKYFEDWDLWLRMKGLNYQVIDEPLVAVRVGEDMFARRVGFEGIKYELKFLARMISDGNFRAIIFLLAIPLRVSAKLLPSKLYGLFMMRILRKKLT
jgi:glycosyltransferase involved in cell wall biosynthesis